MIRFSAPQGVNRLDTHALLWFRSFLQSPKAKESQGVVLFGEPNFGAGGDLRELQRMSPLEARRYVDLGREVLLGFHRWPVPTVAAIQHFALGGALELALSLTYRVATADSWFGHPGARAGLFPGFVGVHLAGRYLRLGALKRLLLTGERWTALQALRHGLVDELVDSPEDLLEAACRWIRRTSRPALLGWIP